MAQNRPRPASAGPRPGHTPVSVRQYPPAERRVYSFARLRQTLPLLLLTRLLKWISTVIEQNLASVEERIHRAAARCGRRREDILLLAVTKKFTAETIRSAFHAGL